MLQIKNICKQYKTGTLIQMALNDVSLNLRDNEFISILGPSGSGKTTLLNIIGGLDKYDSGDMIIDGVSTKAYNSKAWDSYRNHSIGFIFQSYNLIPHQSVLSNVELSLTIGGVSGKERTQRAKQALINVGLEEHMHKRPNQLSGGQMQRVAIARALVNDPKILLADEPTGALDSETGIQVMDILKKVAENRLVIMVTHNPELAEKYSNRIVKLRDGKIIDDSNPYIVEENSEKEVKEIKFPKSKMSFLTSLSLSFNNLRTKSARTIITSVAGSIGIIGIAVILAMSNSVNNYVNKVQRDTIESYPITIDAETYDFGDDDFSILYDNTESDNTSEKIDGKIKTSISETADFSYYEPTIKKNNLSAFKDYLEKPENNVNDLIGSGAVIPQYNTKFQAYTTDKSGKLINTSSYIDFNGNVSPAYTQSAEGFTALPQGRDNTIISKKTKENYDMLYGDWPESADECVIITKQDGTLDARTMYSLGFITADEYVKVSNDPDLADNGKIGLLSYEDICKKVITILPSSFRYEKDENGLYKYINDNSAKIKDIIDKNGIKMKVTGIICPDEDNSSMQSPFSLGFEDTYSIGYTYLLTNKIIDISAKTDIVKAQLSDRNKSVLSGLKFDIQDDAVKAKQYRNILNNLSENEKINLLALFINNPDIDSSVGTNNLNASSFSADVFDQWLSKASDNAVCELYNNYFTSPDNIEDTLYEIGYISYDEPIAITIYTDTFDGKQGILRLLDKYNEQADDKDRITYVDFIKELTDQLSSIINTISYILISFVAVSLVVSCIMIGIITHISVLERTKEIGILRALGASKGNIFQVFNAETFIIGLLSGIIGVLFAGLLCIPANIIIDAMNIVENGELTISLPIIPSAILIIISTFITMIGGFIPADSASRKDPVIALRTE